VNVGTVEIHIHLTAAALKSGSHCKKQTNVKKLSEKRAGIEMLLMEQ